ncbi:double-strand break repair protein AddB [Antarcticirhabdus aurantiaca]|uniref:Double-strand break repair protein AddB n=1 Tax=Antarcticirhabdus aurantiaca TaxID=2606717 RepID=A0ACD4NQD7_9HYPH|nr:double-strand break repair protein AddB [Antarcticirhabdus aurantiaca]WAJ29008.1 double-strand break repair protein AddB [Jeongeuplla avenae]
MQLRVLSIPPGLPFLKTLAREFLDGRIVPGFRHDPADPLKLAGATILLPSRRAARLLAAEFAAALGGGPAILPTLRVVGEADETAAFLLPGGAEAALSPVVSGMERRLILARLVRRWRRLTTREEVEALIEHDIPPPASAADALWLARDLCELLDEAENENVSLDGLAELAPERLSDWWRMTLDFLAILTRHWPDILAARGLVSEASARNAAERALAERLALEGSPGGPMVIAGSTATAPASVELMRAVARLPNGALVLPGLDRDLDKAGWDAIDVSRAIASPGHPQYPMKRILGRLLLPPEAVDHVGGADDPADPRRARERLLSFALRPAETTAVWAEEAGAIPPAAIDGLALVEAPDERTEALAAAIAMRHALDVPGATAALVTPDRNLARRVVAELQRFGIEANDSAGRPLASTAPGTLLSLVLDAALRPGDPLTLVSLLKHPLMRAGMMPGEARRAARAIETIALRGRVGVPDVAKLPELLASALEDLLEATNVPRPVRLVGPNDRELAKTLAANLAAALEPLTALRNAEPSELGDVAPLVTRAVEAAAADPEGSAAKLYAFETGEALAAFLSDLVQAPATGFGVEPGDLPDVVRALLADRTVRPRGGLSTRAFILGTIEARLAHVDLAVLAGLNENTWPGGAKSGAFLSRLMRSEMALEPPERRIGLAAHDFWMAMGAPQVVLSRSTRSGGAPTIASRWLQRLLAVAGKEGAAAMRREGEPYLAHAVGIDRPAPGAPAPAPSPRPAPRPPLGFRPTSYSVTEVETLIRDPYAVYARRVLRLEPMPDLIRSPGAADRGILFHRVLGDFVADGNDPAGPEAETILLAYAREAFQEERLPAEIEAVWWPRMEAMARNVVAWERERAPRVARRLAELKGALDVPDIEVKLTGRADRVDVMTDGSLEIIDFKTGSGPSVKQARTLLAPQLPLEAAMARHGGFAAGGAPAAPVGELLFVRLKERAVEPEPLSKAATATSEAITADDLACRAYDKFRALAALYAKRDTPYPSRARPYLASDFSGTYDHLARAREWSAGVEGEE